MSSLKKSVKINSPLPKGLAGECKKAAKILNAFVDTTNEKGIDQIIPPNILAKAKGLAIFTVIKAGFLWSGRAGTGIVVARLDDGSWSAPSAIGTGGMGFGGQIGAEITDFVMVLNNRSAVKSFMKGGNITLGTNISIAAGPVGVSIEGSIIVERKDTNEAFYRAPVTAKQLLSGEIPPPPQAEILYRALDLKASGGHGRYSGMSTSPRRGSFYENDHQNYNNPSNSFSYSSIPEPHASTSYQDQPSTSFGYAFDHPSNSNAGGYAGYNSREENYRANKPLIPEFDEPVPGYTPTATTSSAFRSDSKSFGAHDDNNPFSAHEKPMNTNITNKTSSYRNVPPPPLPSSGSKPNFVTAMYDFKGQQDTDLSFKKGDRIMVTKRTDSTNDWWRGKLNGREGTFPANYVQ
ncbi:hypothetical protein FBU30_001639 [Linnemannia zychae]|nr:hypothetical protein FBU30_001639 [Linnemannia zychae]